VTAPAPACVANRAPEDGPILGRSSPPALGVSLDGGPRGLPIGVAYPTGRVEHRKAPR
jgi:hypothetical protein